MTPSRAAMWSTISKATGLISVENDANSDFGGERDPPYGTPVFDIGANSGRAVDRHLIRIRPVEYSPALRLDSAAVSDGVHPRPRVDTDLGKKVTNGLTCSL